MIQYLITNERPGTTRTLYADYSARVLGLTFATNNRGFAECTAFVPMGLAEAFGLYNTLGLLRVYITDTSAGVTYDGRLEDISITGSGVTLTALGFSRALSDTLYTALWSDTKVTNWRILTTTDFAAAPSEKYQMDTNNRLYIAARKNETYSSAIIGMIGYVTPNLGTRQITGIQFDWQFKAPNATWQMIVSRRDASWNVVASDVTFNGTGALLSGSVCYAFPAATDNYTVSLYYNGASAAYLGETGDCYVNFTNVRLVTSTANFINTTLTVNRAAGSNVTATVGSTARMYVGQRITMSNAAGTTSETVTVISIGSSTTFNAVFANSYVIGDIVRAHVIYGDEIADDLITATSTLNSNQLSSSLALTNSPALDMLNELYQDRAPCDILDYLAAVGDSSGLAWEWGVKADQRLYFRSQGTNARTWYIDVSDLVVTRLLDQLTNSVYATYQNAGGRTLRSAPMVDAGSIARYGLTRRTVVNVSSTSATQASLEQVVTLADGKNPIPQSGVTIDRVFDANGQRWPLWYVQAGDTMVIRNLPPTLSSSIDRVRIFRLARAAYSFDDDTIELEPESPLPKLDALLARLAAGINTSVGGFRIKGAPGQRVPL